jgi:hypothetical protein
MDYPRGRIMEKTIQFRKQGTNLDPAQIRREFDEWLASIKKHIAGMTQEVGGFSDTLRNEATALLNARLAKLSHDDELLSGLGFGAPKAAS